MMSEAYRNFQKLLDEETGAHPSDVSVDIHALDEGYSSSVVQVVLMDFLGLEANLVREGVGCLGQAEFDVLQHAKTSDRFVKLPDLDDTQSFKVQFGQSGVPMEIPKDIIVQLVLLCFLVELGEVAK